MSSLSLPFDPAIDSTSTLTFSSHREAISLLQSSLACDSLSHFIPLAWPIVEPVKPLIWNWHHDVLCEVLTAAIDRQIKRLIITMPPGLSKSLFCSVFTNAYDWIRNPWRRYLTASYSQDLSIRDNGKVKSIVSSPWYQDNFWKLGSIAQPAFPVSLGKCGEEKFENTRKGWRIASSVKGLGTGEHPDVIILDDLLKAIAAGSVTEAQIDEAIQFLDGTISTRVANDPVMILVMQRLHQRDPAGHLLEKGGWYHLLLPMFYEKKPAIINGFDSVSRKGTWPCPCHSTGPDPLDRRTIDGELLCSQIWTPELIASQSILLGQLGVSGQFQQRPVPLEGGLIKREWIQIVESNLIPKNARRCRGWDTADTEAESKTAKRADWTVGIKLALDDITGTLYIENAIRTQSSPDGVDRIIHTTAKVDGRLCKIREGSGSGKATTNRRAKTLRGYDYAVTHETESKVTRGGPFRAYCESGNVRVVRADWNAEVLDVLCSFPLGLHDDDWDAVSNAFNCLTGEVSKPRVQVVLRGRGKNRDRNVKGSGR